MTPERLNVVAMLALTTVMLAHVASLPHASAMSPSVGQPHSLSPLPLSRSSCFVSSAGATPSLTRSPGLAACRISSALPLRNFDAKTRSVQDSILGQIKQHSRIMRSPLVLQQSNKDSDTADMEEEEVEVVVKDTKTGKTIDCYVDEEVVVDGQEYALVYPCDTPVVLAYVDKDSDGEELIPVSDDDIPKLFPAGLASPFWCQGLTRLVLSKMSSSLTQLSFSHCKCCGSRGAHGRLGDIGDDEEDLEDLGEAGEDEEFVKVITSYEEKGIEYLVTEPLEPVLIIAKPGEQTKSKKKTYFTLPEVRKRN
ncbi:hypothetical protein GUITHDRAFT_146296 [Guillardia theta CCMP2712]|uniref:Ferredoxin thioredoxin reductase alpha chain domain-containing protein n=1 Tax=Guillardia theta (strain CCMP2712) TaxID=905079 RepID=L1IIU8_GUITC|nr:hypothetical protein GUITHDRAFT_146296 [Guillardia theta CCMP2712]EKX35740.1 hypothetical protein GUITHDRAFT_146296 [Guillardia theta CCMP2712]|eukprot:XP_005822720.1 hypothetical protein GUITHDRAFT_146296 [Guillardia theta CCMP2712]